MVRMSKVTALVAALLLLGTSAAADPPAKRSRGSKVRICHVPPGNPDAAHTITVAPPALRAHLDHGDTEGACNARLVDDAERPSPKKSKKHKRGKKRKKGQRR
jgi:hypothetical protein